MRRPHVSKLERLLSTVTLLLFLASSAPLLAAPFDLNTATRSDLMSLKGIGKVRASSIIADREQNGPFRSVDDLKRVKGIGKKTVEKLRPFLRVDADSGESPTRDMGGDDGGPDRGRAEPSPAKHEEAPELEFPVDESKGPDDVETL
jgi:competence protein ComEA